MISRQGGCCLRLNRDKNISFFFDSCTANYKVQIAQLEVLNAGLVGPVIALLVTDLGET